MGSFYEIISDRFRIQICGCIVEIGHYIVLVRPLGQFLKVYVFFHSKTFDTCSHTYLLVSNDQKYKVSPRLSRIFAF